MDCPICFEEVKDEMAYVPTSKGRTCGHRFCLGCLRPWLLSTRTVSLSGHTSERLGANCPKCRFPEKVEVDVEEEEVQILEPGEVAKKKERPVIDHLYPCKLGKVYYVDIRWSSSDFRGAHDRVKILPMGFSSGLDGGDGGWVVHCQPPIIPSSRPVASTPALSPHGTSSSDSTTSAPGPSSSSLSKTSARGPSSSRMVSLEIPQLSRMSIPPTPQQMGARPMIIDLCSDDDEEMPMPASALSPHGTSSSDSTTSAPGPSSSSLSTTSARGPSSSRMVSLEIPETVRPSRPSQRVVVMPEVIEICSDDDDDVGMPPPAQRPQRPVAPPPPIIGPLPTPLAPVAPPQIAPAQPIPVPLAQDPVPVAQHICVICGREFDIRNSLMRHLTTAHTTGRFRCMVDGCGSSFGRNADLLRHRRNIHLIFD